MKTSAAKLPQNYRRIEIMRHRMTAAKLVPHNPPLKGGNYSAALNFSASSFPSCNCRKIDLCGSTL